jgi:RHS repeat-associated protein
VNDRGSRSIVQLDLLGRVRVSYPFADSLALQDSSYYDIAGNLRKVVTRRGTTVTTTYDSRNRDTLTVIPGVGSRRKTYGGPLDQVTRIWDQSPVDSIGGTTTEVRYGYDARGRLKADTAYTGTVARVTSHVYDRYERDSVTTDALGSWKTLYETVRGYPVALVTPYGDSVVYSYDAQSRAIGPNIWNGGTHRVQGTQQWLPNGSLEILAATSYASGVAFNSGSWTRPEADHEDAGAVTLVPYWEQQPGAGTTSQRLTDSLKYDAWQRLIHWELIRDGTRLDSVSYTFDRAGNISQSATPVYSPITDQLLRRGTGSDSMSYDNDGNLTRWRTSAGVVWAYGYDGLNQLVSVRRNGTLIVRYAYDVLGRRIAKRVYSTASGGTLGLTRFSYHGGQVGFETDSAGTTIGLRYTWGQGTDELLSVRDAAGNHFYATRDRLGSVRALTTAAGAWRLSEAFTPYGTSLVRDTAGTGVGIALRYRWTGREYDAETDLYYLRARYYSPDLRRFSQEDPAGVAGGSNLYAYAGGSPLEASDPSGLAPSTDGAFIKMLAAPYGPNPVCFVNVCKRDTSDPTAWNWGVLVKAPFAFQPWWRGTVMDFKGRPEDKAACMADATCSDEWKRIENSDVTQWVTVVVSPTLRSPGNSHYSESSNSWLTEYNPAEFGNGELYGVKIVDAVTVFAHEFGHIIYNDNFFKSMGFPAPKCMSAAYAYQMENQVRAARREYYGMRPADCT